MSLPIGIVLRGQLGTASERVDRKEWGAFLWGGSVDHFPAAENILNLVEGVAKGEVAGGAGVTCGNFYNDADNLVV